MELILFGLFALTLLALAIFHEHPLTVSLGGLLAITLLDTLYFRFPLGSHLIREAPLLLNLLGLLTGFAILAGHFQDSRLPLLMPRWLPDDWKGPFVLLIMVFFLSAFLDNIAAALIGGTVAFTVFSGKVHIGYLAALVAASNAGGAGSVVGDTTTTMLWLSGIPALEVLEAYVGAITALLCFGFFASRQQDRFQRIQADALVGLVLDYGKLWISFGILLGAILANLAVGYPAVGVWAVILLGGLFLPTPWRVLPQALRGAGMLLALVLCASMMPVERLPAASWPMTLGMGFISAVFDNIPLTRLALLQGGYDWGFLAYAVGVGGSMIWFGSSAGVALSGIFPQARSVGSWCKEGWHVILAYCLGFAMMMALLGWHPHPLNHASDSGTSIGKAKHHAQN
jgi:Na+/H+ antiporter NhaD/arsenite permease-like protein